MLEPDATRPASVRRPTVARGASASAAWDALMDALPGLVGNRIVLLRLELALASRRAALAGSLALAALIGAGTAWLLLNAALVVGLERGGVAWGWAVAAAVAANFVLCVFAAIAVKRALTGIGLPTTLRQLFGQHGGLQDEQP